MRKSVREKGVEMETKCTKKSNRVFAFKLAKALQNLYLENMNKNELIQIFSGKKRIGVGGK